LELERLELIGDQALAFLRVVGRDRASEVPVDLETANVYDFEGDRIKRTQIFSERREALELLGLSESLNRCRIARQAIAVAESS
jgi:hypothetical protein